MNILYKMNDDSVLDLIWRLYVLDILMAILFPAQGCLFDRMDNGHSVDFYNYNALKYNDLQII